MDLFDKCHDFTRAKMAKAMGYYPFFIPFDDSEGTEVIINGERKIAYKGARSAVGVSPFELNRPRFQILVAIST